MTPSRIQDGRSPQPQASPLLPFAMAATREPQPSGTRIGVRAPTESSESLPRDAVQAEIQRQLAGVMDQLQQERKRSEEALDQARRLRLELERVEAINVERLDGVPDGVPVYPLTRPPLERLVAERTSTGTAPERYGACRGGHLPQSAEVPRGDRAQEHAAPARGDPGRGGLLGGLLRGWTRPTLEEQGRARDDARQPLGQQDGQANARAEDDNVKRLLDGMERLLNNNQRSEPQETVKTASSVALPVLPGISESAAVDFGDWLHTITNSMGDISVNSSVWWQEVVTCMSTFYEDYVKADQFKRLTMEPRPTPGKGWTGGPLRCWWLRCVSQYAWSWWLAGFRVPWPS